jgi:hypothetical protein
MKVLHVPTTVGGNPQGLSRALRELGVDSESWTLQQAYFNYPCDRVLWLPSDGPLLREWRRLAAIFKAARAADVIHFNFGTTLASPVAPPAVATGSVLARLRRQLLRRYWDALQLVEFTLYRLRGIRMFVHYQGDDARQGDQSRTLFRISIAAHVKPGYYDDASDRFKRRMIKRMARFCDAMYTVNPDLLRVLPARSRFIPYCHISLHDWTPVYPDAASARPLRVGHAPSHRGAKGTDILIRAAANLTREGYELELVLIEGMTHQAARTQMERIDVLVDQLFAGWYGGVAVEAMALGKPVLVYIRHEDLNHIPHDMREDLPFIEVEATTLQQRLRDIIRMPRMDLHELGRRSRAYVERWHDPRRIAADIKFDYEAALQKRRRTCATS